MAQCYARDAIGGGLDTTTKRLNLYLDEGGVDWVQFEPPHSVDEVRHVRAAITGTLSCMQGKLPAPLSLSQHLELGLHIAVVHIPARPGAEERLLGLHAGLRPARARRSRRVRAETPRQPFRPASRRPT
jgi:hypothetical protein